MNRASPDLAGDLAADDGARGEHREERLCVPIVSCTDFSLEESSLYVQTVWSTADARRTRIVLSYRRQTPPTSMRPSERFIAFGVPFVALVAVGSLGLGRLVAGRLEVRDAVMEVDDIRAPVRSQRRRRAKEKFDVEAERRRLIEKKEAVETYEMKPVWRPPE
jgi:hypothetical protein